MRYLIVMFICLSSSLFAQNSNQNLLENPSFENSRIKPDNFRMRNEIEFDSFSVAWTTQKNGSPDIIDSTISYKWREYGNMYMPRIKPHDGAKFVGLRLFGCAENNFIDCREYIVQKLKQPMKKGHFYRFELWLARLDKAFACQDLAVYFSDTLIKKEILLTQLRLRPQIVCRAMPGKVPRFWYRLADTIEANKNFQAIYIGSFVNDNGANIERVEADSYRQSYYFVDDIKLIDLGPRRAKTPTKTAPSPPKIDSFTMPKLESNTIFVFKNLLFDRGKADILPHSFKELDAIVSYLKKNTMFKISILGHTDNEGTPAFNQDLSERRAAAVVQYFIKNGIKADRLRSKGFGETRHVSNNNTKETRQLNRRVEMLLLE